MTAYYNEIDAYAAQWLRNLIDAGHIAKGDVDTRSIVDVRASDLAGYTQCHFFAGLGGWAGALRLAGFPDDRPVWTGSCPCQPFSLAGKQKGFDDERHLWPVWRDLIRERRPATIFGEQVASAAQWLRLVRSDLEAMEYAVGAIPCEAASAGADHLRDRYWFVANANDAGSQGRPLLSECVGERPARQDGLADPNRQRGQVYSDSGRGENGGGARSITGSCVPGYGYLADASSAGAGCGPSDSLASEGKVEREYRGSSRSGTPIRLDGEIDLAESYSERGCWGNDGAVSRASGCDQDSASDEGNGNAVGNPRASDLEWIVGADGKLRRVKSGVRLLAHGVPARVAKLRALGNAIDLRPASAFIRACQP